MSEEIMQQNLLVLTQTYATAKGLALTTVSKRIHGNQSFIDDFIAGKISTTIKTYFGMIERLRDEWPKGTKWPVTRDIPRPGKVAFRAPVPLPTRGPGGRFLGKKVPKSRSRT